MYIGSGLVVTTTNMKEDNLVQGANREHRVPDGKEMVSFKGKTVGQLFNYRGARAFRWSQTPLRIESTHSAYAYALSKPLYEKLTGKYNVSFLYVNDADEWLHIDEYKDIVPSNDPRFNHVNSDGSIKPHVEPTVEYAQYVYYIQK